MEPLVMLHADPLDLLFENRNKSYGAYNLRKYYPQRLLISIGIIFSLVLVTVIIYLYFPTTALAKRVLDFPDTYIEPVYYPPKEQILPPPARPKSPKPPASAPYATPVIVTAQKIPEPMATVDKLKMASISLTTTDGDEENERKDNGMSANGTSAINKEDVEDIPKILDRPEVMPEFPGGIEALKRFLMKNLRMPENGLDAGTEIHVVARFVVGVDGRVGNIEITRAADAVFNTEVKRVIAKMPVWKPGSQNHRNVAVYFNLPVNFVTAE